MNRQITDSRAAKTHLASSSGVYVPPSNGVIPPPVSESRKRKLEGPQEPERKVKVARPPSPATLGPGELFFKADKGTRQARDQLGKGSLVKAARSPAKLIKY
jgi:hypothetical protein